MMSNLISRDAIHDTLDIYKSNVQYCLGDENEIIKTIEVFECFIDRQPTIEAKPVVHGEWINTRPSGMSDNIVCSKCGYDSIANYLFCPNCGAEMRGDEE